MHRSFLSLQGVASPFFSELGAQLRQAGYRTHRINFCGGDWLYSQRDNCTPYRGTQADLHAWLIAQMDMHHVTDMVLFGDCRVIHRAAIAAAQQRQVRVYVFEEGYLRPDWITLELGGVNGYSGMSLEPDAIRDWAQQQPAHQILPAHHAGPPNMLVRALYDISYRMASTALCWLYPHYTTHRPHNGLLEYAGLARRFGLAHRFRKEAQAVTTVLLASQAPYFLFALQLNADFQIQSHSPFTDVVEAIDHVLTSFAAFAKGQTAGANPAQLVIKNHPLDTGLAHYRSITERRARVLDIADRVSFIEAGDLPLLLTNAQGVVLVNSTVGLTALETDCPVCALGTAIFNMPGLTFQAGLDAFWQHPTPPDAALVQQFLAYIKAQSQINGDFYSREGMQRAAQGSLARMQQNAP